MIYIYNSLHKHGLHESKFNVKLHIYHVFSTTSLYTMVIYMYEKENFYTILAKGFIVKEEGGLAYHRVHTFYENCYAV